MKLEAKHFISYSSVDARDLVLDLAAKLASGQPGMSVWVDQQQIKLGQNWDAAVDQAIRNCRTMLFVITADSVEPESVCLDECSRAMRFKKPVIPLLCENGVPPPFLLERRQHIDFCSGLDSALPKLRDFLLWLDTPEGALQQLQDRLADANRDLKRAQDFDRPRIVQEISQLKTDITQQQAVIDDPVTAESQTQKNIEEALARERTLSPILTAAGQTKFINTAPLVAPTYFQDRFVETKLVGDFLKEGARRLVAVIGRGGTGKTAMVCRLLGALAGGVLPDDGGPLQVDGVVYLNASGSHKVNAENIFIGLCGLLPDAQAERLRTIYSTPKLTVSEQMKSLLEAFPKGRTVLLLDNFEDVVDPVTLHMADPSLAEALHAILNLPQHAVKVIITSRVMPRDIALDQPGRQMSIQLDEGLPSPFAENVLLALDADGTLNLRNLPTPLLSRARELTRGFPRALEALYAILSADRSTSLEEILSANAALLPENVVSVLVGEAFSRLDSNTQQVMQALAIYGHPVPAAAVDYLLQPLKPTANCTIVLNRLVNMRFVRKDAERYYMHPVDRDYAFGRIPEGQPFDREADPLPFTMYALLDRAAGFFRQARIAPEQCRAIGDLLAQQIEFDLRFEGKDYDSAAQVLFEISGPLNRWGHFRLLAQKHQQLLDLLTDPLLSTWNLYLLGWAEHNLGDLEAAVSRWEKALTLARSPALRNRQLESMSMAALGTGLLERGRTRESIQTLQSALVIAREEKDAFSEGYCLNELARCCSQLGDTKLGLAYYEQAFKLADHNQDKDSQSSLLSNIGNALGRLGAPHSALLSINEGLEMARDLGNRLMECVNLTNLGIVLIDQDRQAEAIEKLTIAVDIADDLSNLQFQNEARQPLALAYLYGENLAQARELAEAALRHDAEQQSQPRSGLLALLGLIALRQGDQAAGHQYFHSALAESKAILTQNLEHFAVWDSQGLALCGLALCEGPQYLPAAEAAYNSARALTKDAGIMHRAQRLFDALAKADSGKVLNQLRPAIAPAE